MKGDGDSRCLLFQEQTTAKGGAVTKGSTLAHSQQACSGGHS